MLKSTVSFEEIYCSLISYLFWSSLVEAVCLELKALAFWPPPNTVPSMIFTRRFCIPILIYLAGCGLSRLPPPRTQDFDPEKTCRRSRFWVSASYYDVPDGAELIINKRPANLNTNLTFYEQRPVYFESYKYFWPVTEFGSAETDSKVDSLQRNETRPADVLPGMNREIIILQLPSVRLNWPDGRSLEFFPEVSVRPDSYCFSGDERDSNRFSTAFSFTQAFGGPCYSSGCLRKK